MKNIIKSLNPFSNKEVENKIIYTLKILITTFLLYFVSLIIAETIIISGSIPFGYNLTDHQLPSDITLICSFFGYIVTILFFIIFSKKINKLNLSDIGLDKNLKTFFKGILLGIVSLIVIMLILVICGAINFNGLNKNVNYLFLILYFFGYLIQSTMEELICRGYLLHRLKERIPVVIAIIISILFFSIGHLSKLFQEGILLGIIGIFNLFLISMIYINTTLKDKNIYSAIGLHFIWNFILFNIIGLNLSGLETTNSILKFSANNKFLTGAGYGIESSIITVIVLLVMFIISYKNVKKSD